MKYMNILDEICAMPYHQGNIISLWHHYCTLKACGDGCIDNKGERVRVWKVQ